jgi:asparagine synthase (glutamine-hydrolysing)
VGEGADELFFGYTFHNRIRRFVERYWNPVSRLPGFARGMLTGAAAPFVDLPRRDFLRRLGSGGEPFWGGAVTFYPAELERLAPGLAGDRLREEILDRIYAEYDAVLDPGDFPNRAGYLEVMYRLPELLLMRVDKMTMAASVEGRVPFLDHRVVEFAFRLPGHHKVAGEVPKAVLKRAVEPYLPREIVHRPKVGFHVPVTRWFESVLSPLADDVLLGGELDGLGILDRRETERLLADARAGRGNLGMRVWALVNFGLWHRHWMGSGS